MSNVPGSLFRKILFWMHLSCGVVAGAFILLMSATGVTLTYEAQMQAAAAKRNNVAVVQGQQRLTADQLAAAAQATLPEPNPRLSLVIDANPAVPVSFNAGRGTAGLLDPYTGATIQDAAAGTRSFMSTMRSWHRWLGGDSGSFGAKLIDWSNLLFVFIIASGLYLWFPAVMRWRTVRGLVLFQSKYINAKVRDFNWHHVFGVWMLIPLFLIATSGAVMSFPWANNLVYAAFGEKPPQRGGGGPGGPGAQQGGQRGEGPRAGGTPDETATAPAPPATLQQLFDSAVAQGDDWQRITLPFAAAGDHVDVIVELKSTERRPPRKTYALSTTDAGLIGPQNAAPAAAPSRGQQARTWFRFVHTGEQYGVIGQTIAGLASLAACFLVYTGLALAWRRLIRPLFQRAA
jgi:uncharacterized iron-regulated membrane protein